MNLHSAGISTCRAPRQNREPVRIEPLGGERRHEAAQAHAGEARRAIRRVVSERDAGRFQRRDQPGFGKVEEWTDQLDRAAVAGKRRHPCHAGKPGEPAAARHAHEHGLGLVVERVGGEHMTGVDLARGSRQQLIARGPRGLLQAGRGLGPDPRQDAVGHAERTGKPSHGSRFRSGFRPQAMIDGDGEKLRSIRQRLSPARGKEQERG